MSEKGTRRGKVKKVPVQLTSDFMQRGQGRARTEQVNTVGRQSENKQPGYTRTDHVKQEPDWTEQETRKNPCKEQDNTTAR